MKRVIVLAVVAVLMISMTACGSSEPAPATTTASTPAVIATEAPVETISAETEAPAVKMTTGQKNALRAAESYLSLMGFSYEGLIGQLEFDQYSHEDAVFAADNCGADWSEQALKSAKSYLDLTAFSHSGLIKQLEFDKYTTEQATYAADNCGADWNEQAAKSAESYLELMAFSRDGLISQLEFDGFTNEQAVYGAEQNGY